jgi:hypothetical protein
MKKAILKGTFYVSEVGYDGRADDYNVVQFKKGDEVLVLHEDVFNNDNKLFVIYSPKAKEATAVYDGLLEFIE